MNIDEIISDLNRVKWFSKVGKYHERGGEQSIRSLSAWDNINFAMGVDPHHANIAEKMDWLPSSRDGQDPFYGESLYNAIRDASPESKNVIMEVYRLTLVSLRNIDKSKLNSGHNDFSEAAVGAALYCSRMAAAEVVVTQSGVWCDLFNLYIEGYWPCGRMPNGEIVVY